VRPLRVLRVQDQALEIVLALDVHVPARKPNAGDVIVLVLKRPLEHLPAVDLRPDDHRLFDDSLSDYLEIRQPGRAEPLKLGLQSRTALHHTAVREQRELLAPELHPVELADAHLVPVYPALRIARYRKVLPRFVAELRSVGVRRDTVGDQHTLGPSPKLVRELIEKRRQGIPDAANPEHLVEALLVRVLRNDRSEEHTSELQSREKLVCRLLLGNENRL